MSRRRPLIEECVELHPARGAIRDRLAQADGPIPVPQLAQQLGFGAAQTHFHVRVLVACELAAFEDGGVVAVE